MKKMLVTLGSVVCGLTVAAVCMAQKDSPAGASKTTPAPTQSVTTNPASDEKAIHQIIDDVEKAYNSGDAKGLASLFTENAEMINARGDVAHGRAAIEAFFAAVFADGPSSKMTITTKSIRTIGPNLVVEDGTTMVSVSPNALPERSQYAVVYVKQEGKWQMASARDTSLISPSNVEYLQQLTWLIGDWVDESLGTRVSSKYRWSEDGNYIINEFSAKFGDRPLMSGTQRIGWDPLANQIRSWVFESSGGYGEGLWSNDEDRWIIKQRNVTSSGQVGTATNVLKIIDKDRWGWQSYDRVVGGQLNPSIEQIIVVRVPPQPERAAAR